MKNITITLCALALLSCGDPVLDIDPLVGEWHYESINIKNPSAPIITMTLNITEGPNGYTSSKAEVSIDGVVHSNNEVVFLSPVFGERIHEVTVSEKSGLYTLKFHELTAVPMYEGVYIKRASYSDDISTVEYTGQSFTKK